MKYYWFNKVCCVPGCGNTSTEGQGCAKEYFDLPAERQARAKWLNAICIGDAEDLKVCEDHFKGEDIFRDKSSRKKLRLNSVPSTKLPSNLCSACFGSTVPLNGSSVFEAKLCTCKTEIKFPSLAPTISPTNSKKTRIRWTVQEKKTLFKAVKDYGEAKFANSQVRINWASVVNHCRSKGCFGNEKELRTVWQNLRVNASKVYKNEIFGSRLDRKVCRFLYGKPMKRPRNVNDGSSSSSDANNREAEKKLDRASTDEDDESREPGESVLMRYYRPEEGEEEKYGEINGNILYNGNFTETDINGTKEDLIEETSDSILVDDSEDSDEYYSITDVEEKYNIRIRDQPKEIISLLSSDEGDE